MKRMLCILLTLCLVFSGMTVFGASGSGSAGGSGGAASGTKPFIPNYDSFEDGETYYGFFDEYSFYEDEGYLDVNIHVPTQDGGTHGFGGYAGSFTKVNGKTYSTLEQLQAAIPTNIPVAVTIDELQIGEHRYTTGVYEINFDTTPVSYSGKNYSSSTGTFAGLSANLPIFYCLIDEWDGEVWYEWMYPYLDENHYYDIDVYDYGIVIKYMWANGYPASFYNIRTESRPNGKMLSNIRASVWEMWENDMELTGLRGELYDASGTLLQEKTGEYLDYEWCVTFTDLPAENDNYTIKLWGLNGNTVVTPVYSYSYTSLSLEIEEGIITAIEDDSYGDIQAARVSVQHNGQDWSRDYGIDLPVEVGDTVCNTVADLMAAMPVGSNVKMASMDLYYAFQVGEATPEPDTYGVVTNAWVYIDGWDTKHVIVRIVLPNGNNGDCFLSDDLVEGIVDLDSYCESLIGAYGIFALDELGNTIVAMDVDTDGIAYQNVRYLSSSETFSGLSSSTAELPFYYLVDGTYEEPVLNEDALYQITVYDYGVVITDMQYVEINVLAFYPTMNMDFKQDLQVAYGIWDESAFGKTLHVQLLDDRNKVLERASKVIVDGNTDEDPGVWFRNYPNEDATYHLKLWITNETGTQISPTYTESSFDNLAGRTNTTELEIKNGTVVSENTSSDPNTIKIQIKSCPNGIQTPKYVTFSTGTNVNGKTFATAQELAAELPVGTLIEYVESTGNYGSVIRFSKEKQQVVTDANYNEIEKKVTATITLKSNNTTTGTSATGTVYAGVYSKEGILKGVATIPETALSADGTANDVSVVITDITYAEGDYIKAFFWKADNNAAISNAATAKIQ